MAINNQRIIIRLKAIDHKHIDISTQQIDDTANKTADQY
ncbi:30S ribosomal protein S10, partial [Francisella tularensis subsp. holarctica]|nr:30S ribosomal protein S10 [Francisella tularensis subsp. holarctica]